MATSITKYVTSDGKYFSLEEDAHAHQDSLNDSHGKEAATESLKVFLQDAAERGKSKYWTLMLMQSTTKNSRLTKQSTDGVNMIYDIFTKDFDLVHLLANGIGAHKYTLPYAVSWFEAGEVDEDGEVEPGKKEEKADVKEK